MNKKIAGSNCVNCIHSSVCCYKKVVLYDILDEIVIKCKHYYDESKIRMDSNGITFQAYPPVTNPCDDIDTARSTGHPYDANVSYTLTNN